jgi:UDP-N-acetylmuramoylalanine--D-glutamate ligase
MKISSLKGKRVCVTGLLFSGYQLVRYLQKAGIQVSGADLLSEKEKAWVFSKVPQHDKATWLLTTQDEAKILDHDLIIRAVGSRKYQFTLEKAAAKNIPIISELDFVSDNASGIMIGITGSFGKSTTAAFLKKILDTSGLKCSLLGGGQKPFAQALEKPAKIHILEVSSSKLAASKIFKPKIAVLTNLAAIHIERHRNVREYFETKVKIYTQQDSGDYLIYNGQEPLIQDILTDWPPKSQCVPFKYADPADRGIWRNGETLIWNFGKEAIQYSLKDFQLLGAHNIENLMAAIAAAKLVGVEDDAIHAAIPKLEPIRMRLAPIAKIQGVVYYDDAAANHPISTSWALHALEKNVILLGGGIWFPEVNLERFKEEIKKHCKLLILFGADRKKFFDVLEGAVQTYFVETLKEAASLAYEKAQQGDSVLFSPFAMPDLYVQVNNAKRSAAFKKYVEELKERERVRRTLHWELNKV